MRRSAICRCCLAVAACLGIHSGPAPARTKSGTQTEPLARILADGAFARDPGITRGRGAVERFYAAGGFRPVWFQAGQPSSHARAVVAEFQQASSKGLLPDDYDAANWVVRLRHAGNRPPRSTDGLDVALTVSVMRYVLDLRLGRTGPAALPAAFDPAIWLRERLTSDDDLHSAFESLEPPFPAYWRTKRMLGVYRELAGHEDVRLAGTKKAIEPGQMYREASQLAELLVRLGDMAPDHKSSASRYEGSLVDGVKHFQSRHGLAADGILGKATLAELNTPLSERVRQLELTLERWRALPRTFAKPPIVINIPEFRLRALDDRYQSGLSMKVVVGQSWKHQTPVFSADMRYLIFRPYWDVPESIATEELLPKLENDSQYFERNHYEVIAAPDGTTRIRQLPGPDNALGAVKFMFPNAFNVYLHGTPAVELFNKSRRDFSHGCIRVEKPDELASWVLRDRPDWTRERIRSAMNGDTPLQVNLTSPIPVVIVYVTAVVGERGEARFYRDIYGLDVKLDRELKAVIRSGLAWASPSPELE